MFSRSSLATAFLTDAALKTCAHLPECIAEFLDEARGVACGAGDGVKHCAREFPSASGEAFLYEREKFVRVYVPDLERGGGMVERAGILEEDLRHLVTYAAEEDVRSVGVELDSGAQHGGSAQPRRAGAFVIRDQAEARFTDPIGNCYTTRYSQESTGQHWPCSVCCTGNLLAGGRNEETVDRFVCVGCRRCALGL